jgi:hypothetical protein
MTTKLSRLIVLSLAVALFLGLTTRVHAAPVDLLRQAYLTLSEADHDYDGHRIESMKRIEEAAKELGVNLRGDGHDHEKQGISDEHLREAYKLLQEAKGGLSGKPLKHVKAAEHELKIALKIK